MNCHTPRPVMTFTGRNAEAKEAYKMLSKEPVLFISGIAGIGKSEFVKYFAEKYAKKFTNIIYWFYSGNLKRNITEMDFTSDRMDMTDAQRFHAHFQHLKNLKKDSLIIIDNFNVLPKEEPVLKELMQYDFSILVTTRCKLTTFPVFEIKELNTEKELLPLFGNICPYEDKETDSIHNIIDTVHAHTLTVCLSALSMSASGISPSDLLYELKSCGTDIVSGEDVELYKDGEFSEGLMIEHLKKLLRITNLTEEQLQKLTERIEYIMNEFHIATPCDRALLLDYKAELLLEDGKPEKALKKRKRAIEIMEKEYAQTIDQRTVSLLSNLYNNIGATYSALHKKTDAIAALEKAFLIRIEHKELNLIETHDILQQMMNITRLMLIEKRTSDAENLLSTYEMIVTERLGTDSLDFGICKLTHGIIAMQQSRMTEAEQFLLDAEQILQYKIPQGNDYLKNAQQYLYALYKRLGKYALAEIYKSKLIKV